MITSKNIPLFLRSILFSCQPKLIQSITPNHECRARLLRMWHLTRRQALLIGVLDPWRFCFSKPMTIVIYIHGAVLDLLLMVLEVCHGHIHMWSKGNQCLWTGILVPHRHRLHLGKMVACGNISIFCFPSWCEGEVWVCRWPVLSPPARYCRAAFPQQEQGSACLGTGLGSLCGSFYPCAK